jgi:hypothetical protein
MFLGSQQRFKEIFGERLSTRWCSRGYLERCGNFLAGEAEYQEILALYGEENAEFLFDTLHPAPSEIVYIQHRNDEAIPDFATEVVRGSADWFRQLVYGPWHNWQFLVVLPGQEILPIYDMEEVFTARNKT